jgi:hypothetical protein
MLRPLQRNWMFEQLFRPLIVTENLDNPLLRPVSLASFMNQSASFTAVATPMYSALNSRNRHRGLQPARPTHGSLVHDEDVPRHGAMRIKVARIICIAVCSQLWESTSVGQPTCGRHGQIAHHPKRHRSMRLRWRRHVPRRHSHGLRDVRPNAHAQVE